ncbi:hypothetical protein FisN_24Hh019 [Fistulifera solaris]|uniref:Uncharacterized protein n=1 Tax=Fistulifera solaris TaxID=1519565 RepID=A0A1Z5KJH6_FISSO|nr:hypothetical protein FisN_24Hh019 [Fistulifera solaris]|eukprot:GAX26108.1 hypothetical protein FisN_24Hh019 [Fistulifera solaris]
MKFIIQASLMVHLLVSSLASEEASTNLLRRNLQVAAKNYGSNHSGNLELCEGHCETDADCRGNLVCFQRDAGDGVPGCSLSEKQRNSRTDYCVARLTDDGSDLPSLAPTPTMAPSNYTESSDVPSSIGDAEHFGFNGRTFALKLYWEPGYNWQNEPFERKWCMSMTCRRFCRKGSEIAIYCNNGPTQWEFVFHGPNEVQIKVAQRNLCIQEFLYDDLELAQCDSSNQKQRFVAARGSFDGRRFEISPKLRRGWCFTQRHHPKSGEYVNLEPCVSARREGSRTSYWNKY